MSELRKITQDDTEKVLAFLDALPEGDQTFWKEHTNPGSVERWIHDERIHRWILVEDGDLQAMLAIVPGVGWSSHVGELRLVVGPAYRRRGLGRRLARYGLTEAVRLGLLKIIVEVVADKEGDIEMFTSIGFRPEALLQRHIRDRKGELRDLVLLSHDVEEVSASMDMLGVDVAVGSGAAS